MKSTLSFAALFSFIAFTALAAPAQAKPVVGTRELRLNQGFLPGLSLTGLNVYNTSDKSSASSSSSNDSLTLVSMAAGLGYFVSDTIEIGATANLMHLSVSNDSITSPGISPFLRLFSMVNERLGVFGEATLVVQPIYPDHGKNDFIWGGGVDVGIESFFTDTWALRIALGFKHLEDDDGNALNIPGINWGIAAYF